MSKPEFVYTTYIETTPEKLWHALESGQPLEIPHAALKFEN